MKYNIKTLIIGQSAYSNNENYGPVNIEESNIDYPFKVPAFIPEIKNDSYDLYKLLSYRRLMGFLAGEAITYEDFFNYKEPMEILKKLKKKGIYLVNIDELKNCDKSILDNYLNNDAKIIAFGSKAIEDAYKILDKKYKVLEFPHPSPQNTDILWENFQEGYSRKNYMSPNEVKEMNLFKV